MFYLDASFVVALLTPEVHSDNAERWIATAAQPLTVSPWVVTEVSSALATKVRTGPITAAMQADALARWQVMVWDMPASLPISDPHFISAAGLADRPFGLRAGDALHLAIVAGANATLVTFDRRFAKATEALGLVVVEP